MRSSLPLTKITSRQSIIEDLSPGLRLKSHSQLQRALGDWSPMEKRHSPDDSIRVQSNRPIQIIILLIIPMHPKKSNSLNSKPPFFRRNFNSKNHSVDKTKSQNIDFVLVGNSEVGISMPYAVYDSKKKQLIKSSGGSWDDTNRLWVVDSGAVKQLTQKFKSEYPEILLNEIPELTYRALSPMGNSIEIKNPNGKTIESVKYSEKDLQYNPEALIPFHQKLFPFQRDSVKFGVQHHGRVLLGDQMGVGKTIQALALAYIYKEEWPLLVICPSSLKYNWQDEILRWYKDIRQFQVQVIKKVSNAFKREKTKILIISYEMCRRNIEQFEEFKTVIVDEAHYLKTLDSKRSETLVPFLKNRKRVFLLTGTPALAKPKEIFNLLSIIRPDIYYNFKQFGVRYCDPQKSPWSNAIQYNGCKYPNELYYMINNRIMIRRLKKEVLTELPPKMRQKIIIECETKHTKEIATILANTTNLSQKLSTSADDEFNLSGGGAEISAFTNAYSLTAQAKLEGVKEYLQEMVQNDVKMIIFAHHRIMLDGIDELLNKQKVTFMRIDGDTPPEKRASNVKEFQQKSNVRAALLSITAAGVGLTLTASSTVIFAELHWTPAVMFQAEDRAHRIGQPSCVNCHYLIGEGTIDDYIYNKLEHKFNSVSLMVDGQTNRIGAEELGKGGIGNISKAAEVIKKQEESAKKQKQMMRLADYWKKEKQHSSQSKISEISSTQKQSSPSYQTVDEVTESDTDSQQELKILLKKKVEMEHQTKRVSEGTQNIKYSP